MYPSNLYEGYSNLKRLIFHSDVSNQILDLYESCPNVNAIKGEGTAVGGKLVSFQTMNVEAPFAFLFLFVPQLTNWNYYLGR